MLKKYLENGTSDEPSALTKSAKLSSVGFLTKNLGGYRKISSRGLKALHTVNTKGKILVIPARHNNTNKAITTPRDLLILFFFFVFLIFL